MTLVWSIQNAPPNAPNPSPMEERMKEFLRYTSAVSDNQWSVEFGTTGSTNLTMRVLGTGFTFDINGKPTGGTVTSYDILNAAGTLLQRVTGFVPVAAVTFDSAIINDNTFLPTGRYQFLVSLLNDNTTANGSAGADGFEVGAGNDTINSGAGNDSVYKWKAGNVTYNAGLGSDSLVFNTATGPSYPTAFAQTLMVNLLTGAGLNPYGGTLALSGVENIVGTSAADQITGNNDANIIGDGLSDTGADIISTLGGNDHVELAEGSFGVHAAVQADGGLGTDTLAFNYGLFNGVAMTHTLDLTNQANNTGVFANGTFTNFEVFVPGSGFFAPGNSTLVFRDTADGHTVTAASQNNTITLNAGNDILKLSTQPANYRVTADGGTGGDTLQFEVFFFAGATNTLDLLNPANNTGIFANSTFANFEIFTHVELDGGNTAAQLFTFRGNDFVQIVRGALGIDTIALAGGNDVASGAAGNDRLDGGAGNDNLDGGAGLDTLIGGLGNDTMTGGDGNDIYFVDSLSDIVTETNAVLATGGTDRINSTVPRTLGLNLEQLVFTGAGVVNGTGNALNNVLIGNVAANTLSGLAGNDMLNGGIGNDVLTGGVGLDTFLFNTALSSALNRDTITDFNRIDDTVRLENAIFTGLGAATGVLAAGRFWASATGLAHDADDRIVYNTVNGVLTYDANGSAAGGTVFQFAILTTKPALTNADFLVI